MSDLPITLFLLPYAGAGAAVYREWKNLMPDWIVPVPLHLPGRGIKLGTPLAQQWPVLMEVLLHQAVVQSNRPFAIFGHSMGALVGLELAHGLRSRYGRSPIWLGASGCVAPQRRKFEAKWQTCSREEMVGELERLGGTSSEVLANPDFLDLMLPILRSDFHLCGTYRKTARLLLDCPILALGGNEDSVSDPRDNLLSWSQETSGSFDLEMFNGSHFFLETSRSAVIDRVIHNLSQAAHLEHSQCER